MLCVTAYFCNSFVEIYISHHSSFWSCHVDLSKAHEESRRSDTNQHRESALVVVLAFSTRAVSGYLCLPGSPILYLLTCSSWLIALISFKASLDHCTLLS